mgnify:FL=1
MHKALNICLYLGGEEIAKCDGITLEFYSTTTARKFFFQNVRFNKKVNVSFRDKLSVKIFCFTKYKSKRFPLYEFDLLLLDFDDELRWANGLINNNYDEEYKQGIINVFNQWGKNQKIDWFTLPLDTISKSDYISACFYYSSLSTNIVAKDIYILDVANAKEYRDILYLCAEEFFGDRGYMGHSFHSFADCVLEIGQKLENKKIIIKNCKNLVIKDDYFFLQDVMNEFLKYGVSFFMEE